MNSIQSLEPVVTYKWDLLRGYLKKQKDMWMFDNSMRFYDFSFPFFAHCTWTVPGCSTERYVGFEHFTSRGGKYRCCSIGWETEMLWSLESATTSKDHLFTLLFSLQNSGVMKALTQIEEWSEDLTVIFFLFVLKTCQNQTPMKRCKPQASRIFSLTLSRHWLQKPTMLTFTSTFSLQCLGINRLLQYNHLTFQLFYDWKKNVPFLPHLCSFYT